MALSKLMNLLCVQTLSSLSVFSSHPLFSCIITLCTLILLYLPHLFWKLVLSPVLILTGILLLAILRFGANQRSQDEQSGITSIVQPGSNQENRAIKEEKEQEKIQNPIEAEENDSLDKVHQWIATTTTNSETEFKSQMGFGSNALFEECFVESWNVKAPLEVIYEEYEEKDDTQRQMDDPKYLSSLLSRYYPESESDSDSSSEGGFPAMGKWDSPENICFRWDEEDREGLIEIALDGGKKRGLEFQFEEENLIEIDISPTRNNEFSGENEVFSGEISGN
ncbi:putative transmembrane protein [Senna tora]|uniref:Putative transmembrane protein n=1 Tax=Senna tora TaxID=362788 RepID=A0A834W443_9FABA|nr:putative transmembrane protein [Senna tora]